ncbi:MAG TPA: ATP-dependent helicase, partial [Blastococcus sp.]|nr:ATP-dependent helicase [Blastococcus sp.]
WDDIPRWQLINKALDLDFADPPETYSTSTWVYTDLDVPETATGRLPRSQRTREGLEAETLEDLGETGKRNRPTSSGGRDSGGRGDSRGPSGGRQGSPRSGDGEQGTDGGKSRPRRRTRGTGGASAGQGESAPAAAADSAPSDGAATKPRRRRRRGGANRGGGGSESAA